MKNPKIPQKESNLLQKSQKLFNNLLMVLYNLYTSIINFLKSSFLSILLLCVVFLLLSKMEQTTTLLIAMLEPNEPKLLLDLFFSFILLSALAILISHYPIYIYYALGINNSDDYIEWERLTMGKKFPLNRIPIYTFKEKTEKLHIEANEENKKKTKKNRKDYLVNALRYSLGIVIFGIWIYYIFHTFEQKLGYGIYQNLKAWLTFIGFLFFIIYFFLKVKHKELSENVQNNENTVSLKKIHQFQQRVAWYLFISTLFTLLLFCLLIFNITFSKYGFYVLIFITFFSTLNYIFFRLIRTNIFNIYNRLSRRSVLKIFLRPFNFLSTSKGYLRAFGFTALTCLLFIIYVNIASICGLRLPNAIPILLAYFYFYYWVIAVLIKYMFASRKVAQSKKTAKKIIGFVVLFVLVSVMLNTGKEINIHQLDQVNQDDIQDLVVEDEFIESIKNNNHKTMFFIASHGGGLKANAWTLSVLNELQRKTNGKLLNQTIAFSGASGGSLGLALYTSLYKNHGNDYKTIKKKIKNITLGNYTSIDLSMVLGIDSYRKFFPFNYLTKIKDRPYYAMLKYQNYIEKEKSTKLLKTSYRKYWADLYKDKKYFPSLIMNSSATNGKRSILWSVKTNKFDSIFHFAEDLAELKSNNTNKTLTYYQAVSTTNRFPIFSPAAKIDGYGHYMDAGAIDNSGLLSCFDLYYYLLAHKKQPLAGKKIVFIEIINGTSNYTDKVLNDYLKNNNLTRITKEEDESDNIMVNIETGLNLDKIPQYLHYFLKAKSKNETNFEHISFIIPRKVEIKDINTFISGKISDTLQISLLEKHLKTLTRNIEPYKIDAENNFFKAWKYYEPTLSRHLSKSSHDYIKKVLKHKSIKNQVTKVKALVKD